MSNSEFQPCEFAHSESFDANSESKSRTCDLISRFIGWRHAVAPRTCEECMCDSGGFHPDPGVAYTATVENRIRDLVLHPLRLGMSDEAIQQVLHTTREDSIAKALSMNVAKDQILEAIIQGVKRGFSNRRALELAEGFSLFDEDSHA